MSSHAAANVLVVEDSDEDFDTMGDAAARQQVPCTLVRVLTADAARAALATGQVFRLVILDNSLPGEDGHVLLRALRSHPLHWRVPVVAFTAAGRQPDRDVLYAAGVNAFHMKSVRYEANLWTLEMILSYWLRVVAE